MAKSKKNSKKANPDTKSEISAAMTKESSVSTKEISTSDVPVAARIEKKPRHRLRRTVFLSLLAVVLIGAASLLYGRMQQDPVSANQQLIAEVGEKALLPSDETPAITTVIDETQLNQEFLRSAKEGDKVLLYFQAGKAIVYRPANGKIVNMGPLETPKPRVFLRNGSQTNNITTVANAISNSSEFVLASRDESPKKTYARTIVIDLSGTRPDVATRLAQLLKATVATLPEGESRPDGDVMVIVGKDQ